VFRKIHKGLEKLRERVGLGRPDLNYLENQRPKVIVYETEKNKKRKLLELKLVMVAEQ
jgi:hypothetical protein